MKTLKLFSLLFVLAAAALAQNTPKVIAVINRADWCPPCKANGPRVMSEVIPAFQGMAITFVANDLTNDNTTTSSRAELAKLGVAGALKNEKATGRIYLIDAKTHQVIEYLSVTLSTEELKAKIKAKLS